MYYRNANCAVVVYDITQSASLEKARSWIRELQRQADPSIVIALCGNKADLSARRQVSQEEAKKYADEEGLMWGETSAKTGEGVQEIFTAIGQCFVAWRTAVAYQYFSQETSTECTCVCKSWWPCRSLGQDRRRSELAGQRRSRPERAMQLLSVHELSLVPVCAIVLLTHAIALLDLISHCSTTFCTI